MFPNLRRVSILTEALSLLSDPAVSERGIWLHDYNEKCYREDPKYTRNGLHFGYPRGVVQSITGKDPEGTGSGTMACFVDPTVNQDRYKGSRFTNVRYGDVKEIIELGIHQDLMKATVEASEEAEISTIWASHMTSNYPHLLNRTLRLETEGEDLLIIIVKPERFVTRGMGTFLEGIQPEEVSCSANALGWLKRCSAKSGMIPIEVFPGPIFAGMLQAPATLVERAHVSVGQGAMKDLEPLLVVEEFSKPGVSSTDAPSAT